MITLDEIMAEYGLSRATVYRRLTAAGVRAELTLAGRKQYDSGAVMRAIAGIPQEGQEARTA